MLDFAPIALAAQQRPNEIACEIAHEIAFPNAVHHEAEVSATLTDLTVCESPAAELVPFEQTNEPITDAIRQFRASWLGSRTGA